VAVADRETVQDPVYQLAVDCGQEHLVHSGARGAPDRLKGAEFQVLGRGAAGAAPQHVGADVPADHGQPGIEAALPGEVRQRLPGSGKGLLSCILGFMAIVQPPQAEAQQPLVVAGVQASEGGRIPGLTPFHERAVPVEVHVVAQSGEPSLS
jgi:hypothetical protein